MLLLPIMLSVGDSDESGGTNSDHRQSVLIEGDVTGAAVARGFFMKHFVAIL